MRLDDKKMSYKERETLRAMPDPTDAELDEWEQKLAVPPAWGDLMSWFPVISRLIKALRACRKEAEAKDAVVGAARHDALDPSLTPWWQSSVFDGQVHYTNMTVRADGRDHHIQADFLPRLAKALAALDKEVGDAE